MIKFIKEYIGKYVTFKRIIITWMATVFTVGTVAVIWLLIPISTSAATTPEIVSVFIEALEALVSGFVEFGKALGELLTITLDSVP